jgi:type IV secretory pathway protease TraF
MGAADQSAGMRLARWSAVVIIIAVGAAAFRLSFATLKDLAVLAHIPASDAWLFPLIVDGTILLATFGVLVLANAPERRFFVTVLVIGSVVSVAGNSLHAVAAGRELPWWASALVAAIAPISLLADTHGLALLIRAAQRDSASEPAPVVEPAAEQAASEPVPEPEPVPVPEPKPESLPVPEPVRVAELRPVPDAPVQLPVRSSRPVQTMLPIAVPVGG